MTLVEASSSKQALQEQAADDGRYEFVARISATTERALRDTNPLGAAAGLLGAVADSEATALANKVLREPWPAGGAEARVTF